MLGGRGVGGLSCLILLCALFLATAPLAARPKIAVGSKAFPESWILGAAVAELVDASGAAIAEHKMNLGGTEITYQALKAGSIDVYPEYTGTLSEVILKDHARLSHADMRKALGQVGLGVSDSLGFNDGYALAVTRHTATRLRLEKISDLRDHGDLRLGMTHEFLGRADGFAGLSQRYGLTMTDVRGVQHELAYEALAHGQIDVMDIYTTDPQIEKLALSLLADDLSFFPRYEAVLLYRLDLQARAPGALEAMMQLQGSIDEKAMMRANAAVVLSKASAEDGARALLHDALGVATSRLGDRPGVTVRVGRNVLRHLELVGISLFFAVMLGVPLGILATRSRWVALLALASAGLLQTVPSLALLAFLIPVFGIGAVPALLALFVYSLLPIVQSTFTGLTSIPSSLDEAADAIGLTKAAKLWRVALPMASPAILGGIKTSAVINIGTATLAALIGAEGLGNPIMQGIALRDTRLILEGSVPAALLALAAQGAFFLLDRMVIPKGLRLSSRAP